MLFNHQPLKLERKKATKAVLSSERRLDSKITVPEGNSFDTHE